MRIGTHEIGTQHPPFLIAEAGLNHCGDLKRALDMIAIAKQAGCDAVKFQTYKTSEFCRSDDPMYATFLRCELEPDDWPILKAECDRQDIIFLSTPQNRSDLDILLKVGIPAIKVGSDDFVNLPLLRSYAAPDIGLPLILSMGMADADDIAASLRTVCPLISSDGQRYHVNPTNAILMVCSSQYPCPPSETRLSRISTLREWYPELCVGFSDHTRGSIAAIAAVALGARVFEKHFRLSIEDSPEDFAELPDDLAMWAARIRIAHSMLGDGSFTLTEREAEAKRKYQRRAGEQLRGAE